MVQDVSPTGFQPQIRMVACNNFITAHSLKHESICGPMTLYSSATILKTVCETCKHLPQQPPRWITLNHLSTYIYTYIYNYIYICLHMDVKRIQLYSDHLSRTKTWMARFFPAVSNTQHGPAGHWKFWSNSCTVSRFANSNALVWLRMGTRYLGFLVTIH